MAKKATNENSEISNPIFDKIVNILKEANIQIHYPICVNTFNNDKEFAHISCNFMATGIKIPLNEIDFSDFRYIDRAVMQHNATWLHKF